MNKTPTGETREFGPFSVNRWPKSDDVAATTYGIKTEKTAYTLTLNPDGETLSCWDQRKISPAKDRCEMLLEVVKWVFKENFA